MALYHSPQITTSGLTLYLDAANPRSYPGSGTTWFDLSGNGGNGTIYAASFNNESNSFFFNGTTSYIEVPHSAAIAPSTGSITVEAIFKASLNGSINTNIIYNKESEYELAAGGGFITYAYRPNWNWVGNTAFVVNKWYSTFVTYDQSKQILYVNGQQAYTANQSGAMGTFSNALRLGARGSPVSAYSFFNGFIAYIKIYNRALSSVEVAQNFNATRGRFGI